MSKRFYCGNRKQVPTFTLNNHNRDLAPASAVEPLAVSRKEAAMKLGISIAAIDRHVKNGELIPSRLGRCVRFAVTELQAFLERSKVTPK